MNKLLEDDYIYEKEQKKKREGVGLSVSNFATIPAVKGKQFGREIYSSMILFKDLVKFLDVFKEVQRDMNINKVRSIKNYVITGMDDGEKLRFFNAITVTCRGHMFYDDVRGNLAIDTNSSKLSVNDGQHRFYGIDEAIKHLRETAIRTADKHKRNALNEQAEELENMSIPLCIFNQITEVEEKQLFHDINYLQNRPSRNAIIRLGQTDKIAIITRELVTVNRFMLSYGVEMEQTSIHKGNPNFMLLSTVYASTKELLKTKTSGIHQGNQHQGGYNKHITDENYKDYLTYVSETFDDIFRVMPYDIPDKRKYMAHNHFVIRGICKYIRKAREESVPEPLIFQAIGNVNWHNDLEYWSTYGASRNVNSTVLRFSSTEGSVTSVASACMDNLKAIISEAKNISLESHQWLETIYQQVKDEK